VHVIIPVYGAAAELALCLESVVAETDLTGHRVVIVVDGPQQEAVESVVTRFASANPDAIRVLRNDHRVGFAASVNRGMTSSASDVVLLNSDTIVTAQWLEKMIDAVSASGDIGTVTPLSNHATLCSVPRAFEENLIPSGFDVASFAALVDMVSERTYPRIPTGVGFCLYIRRALLDDIGLFDEQRFGSGYGEENDFCMRALARGWLHIADDATFVFHSGHRSFGASRESRQRRARGLLSKTHPRYMATIAEFMRVDPLASVRARIVERASARDVRTEARTHTDARQSSPSCLRIIHLVHGWPPFQHAGTELYAYWLVSRQREHHDVAVYARSDDRNRDDGDAVELLDRGVRVRLVTNNFTSRNPIRRNAIAGRQMERDFERFLRDHRPHLLHIHHLAGHTFSLAGVARRLGIPIVMQVQDWWALCARVNLMDRDGNRCTGPSPEKCARCVTLTRIPPASMTNRIVHAMRRAAARKALGACDAFVAGSNAIRSDYAGIAPPATPFHVLPYGVAITAQDKKRAPVQRPIRFGFVGSIAPHKGVHVAVDAMRAISPSDATLRVWGDADAFPAYVASMKDCPNLVFEGRFREEEKPRVFAAMDVLLVPSIGLESFGLAAREAMTCGVPVIASAGGALSEMFEPGVGGDSFLAGDAVALSEILQRLVKDPSIIDRWSEHLPTPKRDDVHAEEIEQVYRSVLAARG
jgi:glycosyltransferase involved in cell wall biosynthesis/GT2 family glycosyltransferase